MKTLYPILLKAINCGDVTEEDALTLANRIRGEFFSVGSSLDGDIDLAQRLATAITGKNLRR